MLTTDHAIQTGRSRARSPYMEWAKAHPALAYNLAASGMPSWTLAGFVAEGWLRLEDLELSGAAGYGYPPLEQAIAAKAGVSPERVVAASGGCSMANQLAMAAAFEPGDEVLIEQPTYELLVTTAEYLGAKVRRFTRRFEEGFRLDPGEVAQAITPQTRLIAITNLHNPSSALADEATLGAVGEIALSAGARVLVDEIYLETHYSTPWRSSIHLGDHFIVTSSLTKAYGLSGLRCGWALASPEIARAMWHINDLHGVHAPHPAELLSVIALNHLREIGAPYHQRLDTNRQIVNRWLDERPEMRVARSPLGTTLFPRLWGDNSEAFCNLLREKFEVGVVPGKFFECPPHFRMFLGADTPVFTEALTRIGAALDLRMSGGTPV
jgi:aspartate/methionine/tyrosine aminotransferase